MHFSQAQILELTGMTLERLRHWKKGMPDLERHKGRRPSFSLDELIALAVMNQLTNELGVTAAHLAPHSAAIFAIFAEDPFALEPGAVLRVTKDEVALVRSPVPVDAAAMALSRIDVIAGELYDRIVAPKGSPQLDLPLA